MGGGVDTKAVEGESSVEGGKRLLKEQCSIVLCFKVNFVSYSKGGSHFQTSISQPG